MSTPALMHANIFKKKRRIAHSLAQASQTGGLEARVEELQQALADLQGKYDALQEQFIQLLEASQKASPIDEGLEASSASEASEHSPEDDSQTEPKAIETEAVEPEATQAEEAPKKKPSSRKAKPTSTEK